ncbi:uncharacterized protein LOC111221223 isoform X1 [Seriola dumerili]|uniref:uncharacterized protein LOC111221223 isoform X1 n=1 Tax=Seriola dumerili TaxID=41447 RepID=UPI000BBF0EC2|nr:uncharacterized protein LOC111221223 isoform X1 [Seriola dumerili]
MTIAGNGNTQATGFWLRMTSCLFSLFFLVSLFPFITADNLTGIKVRITNEGLAALKDFALTFLDELINKPQDFVWTRAIGECSIKGLTLTNLTVDPAQIVVGVENSGPQFEIKDLHFTAELGTEVNLCLFGNIYSNTIAFEGSGVSTKIGVRLIRTQQGRLNVELPDCQVSAENIATSSNGISGAVLDTSVALFHQFFIRQLCTLVRRYAVPKVNTMLGNFIMVQNFKSENYSIDLNFDYTLSEDITVTSSSIDVSFKALVYSQGKTVDMASLRTGTNPVFSKSDRMVNVGISESVFNSAGMSLYDSGPINATIPGLKGAFTLELTEAPHITVSHKGFFVNMNATAQSLEKPSQEPHSISCQANMKIDIKRSKLVLLSKDINCKANSWVATILIKFGSGTLTLFKWFSVGLPLPLPKGVEITHEKINYYDGFIVIEGDLNVTPVTE